VCDGEEPACVECTESLLGAVRIVLDPKRRAKREAAAARAREGRAVDSAHTAWRKAQQAAIAERYSAVFPSEETDPPRAAVREMIATLAVLRYSPSTTPIAGINSWPHLLHPDTVKVDELLGSLVWADLLHIHPSSPADAFVWKPESFQDALCEAAGDLDNVADPELTDGFYPSRARYFAPFGASPGAAAERLDAHVGAALALAAMTAGQHEELLICAQELIADEALRYFHHRLEELHLPPVPENHRARLAEAAHKTAAHRSLGEIYSLVWRATRAAAEAAQKNPRAPRAHMSTHAINRLEADAQRAVADLK
jgi:hypothetical protein